VIAGEPESRTKTSGLAGGDERSVAHGVAAGSDHHLDIQRAIVDPAAGAPATAGLYRVAEALLMSAWHATGRILERHEKTAVMRLVSA